MVDIDRPKNGAEPFAAPKFDRLMSELHPWWSKTARSYRPSASSHIIDAETGEILIAGGSLRCHVFVDRGEMIPAVGVALADRFWKAGLGRIEFGSVGQMLVRGPVDFSVWSEERLDFCGEVVLGPRLAKQRFPAWILPGSNIDSAAVVASGPGYRDLGVWASNSLEVRKARSAARPAEKRRTLQTIDHRVIRLRARKKFPTSRRMDGTEIDPSRPPPIAD